MNPAKKIHQQDTSFQGSSREGVAKLWECPICLLIPADNIYMCNKGHSICNLCVSKVKTCPSCRVKFGENKLRNYGLEQVLDTFRLKCLWNGCNEEHSRGDISEHQENCAHNPDGITICNVLDTTKGNCTFRFTTESLQDPRKVERLLEHLKTAHGIQAQEIKLYGTCTSTLKFEVLKSLVPQTGEEGEEELNWTGDLFSESIFSMEHGTKKHLFVRWVNISLNDAKQPMFSFMLIQITPDTQSDGSTFTVNQFIRSTPTPEEISKWGPGCMLTITSKIMPMKISQFLQHLVSPAADQQPMCPFRMPFSHLEEYYVRPNKEIEFGFSIIRK